MMWKKRIVWFIVIGAVGIAVWNYREHFTEKGAFQKAVQEKGSEDADVLEQKVLSFTIDGRSPKGVKQWHLEGNSARISGEDIHLTDLRAVAYGEDVTVHLESDEGVYHRGRGEVELIGNVKVVSDDGLILTTERTTWSQTTKEISTNAVVHIKRGGMNAVGKGGMANSDEGKAMLKENVMVIMEPDTKVNCDGPLEVNYNDYVAVFYGNVRVEDKDGKLFADKLTVNFDPETQKLAQVMAEGNVKIKRGRSYTISEKVIYTGSTKSARLLGKPQVIIDPAELAELEGAAETDEVNRSNGE